jgi:CO/xanthine dehydrogenase FAD-binding subunit
MLLPKFEYHQPSELSEAFQILEDPSASAAVLAGGTDLLVNLKNRTETPEHLVSLSGLTQLGELERNGSISIGASVTAATLANGSQATDGLTALQEGAASLGSPQIRNRATVGGNLCSARSAADLIPPLLVLGATLVLASSKGERQVDLNDFLLAGAQTVLQPGELLIAIKLDTSAEASGSAFIKIGQRRAMEIARVNAAASLTLADDGKTIGSARVALGAVGPRATLSPKAEALLKGQPASEELFTQAGLAAVEDASPRTCHEFKCEVVSVLTRRCLMQSWQQARGQSS